VTVALLEDYMTPAELAQQLRIHPRTLRKFDTEGFGPPKTPIGRKILYRRAAVTEWLLERECSREEKARQRKARAHRA
jgi:hypothetical protein